MIDDPTTNRLDFDALVDRVCARIAPTWPLDRFIAVNPFWEMIDEPIAGVSAKLTALSGARLLMPRTWYREQLEQGVMREEDLQDAVARSGSPLTAAQLETLLASDTPSCERRARVMDVVDKERDLVHHMSWRDYVTHTSSQFCASYFDDGQAQLGPDRTGGLYASWRRHAAGDRTPALLMDFPDYRATAQALPESGREMISVGCRDLGVPEAEREAYLVGLLLDLNGWAAWCAYLRWTARLAGNHDEHLRDLLAVRLAWEWMLFRAGGADLARRWKSAMAEWPAIDAAARASQSDDWLLQSAIEIAWQRKSSNQLAAHAQKAPEPSELPSAQLVFCIDVRSEIFRRAIEAESAHLQTLGFAGFFGLPIAYEPLASGGARPQLPGLLAPTLAVRDETPDTHLAARRASRLDLAAAWKSVKTSAISTFAFVEAMGIFSAVELAQDSFAPTMKASSRDRIALSAREDASRKPRLAGRLDGSPLDRTSRTKLAEGVLRAMSLTRNFARLVVLVGHGSQTRNNPHAAGLDCGACCGQTGEVNARALAALLNEADVRADLAPRGILIPETTRFVPALHDTTTDEVTLFEIEDVPATHATDIAQLRASLNGAGARARRERAKALGLADAPDDATLAAMRGRAHDWAQIRPEWGLANNAAFVVAPRARSRGIDFSGRAFLHDYRFEDDEGFAILELIMTAPMVVAHWINFQYYASTVDNRRYGSGNKLLHNVVGGHLGVFEGNGGDLRIGLPLQSLHDGARWMHTPLRLSVFIEAPADAITAILRKHAHVRALVDNGWLHLFQIDGADGRVRAHRRGDWVSA
jgi:uncharacterized protein YbcC (UPF0753/DUF2309 family)